MFVRATNWLRWVLPKFAGTLFPPISLREPQHVFRAGSPGAAENQAADSESGKRQHPPKGARPAVSES